MSILLNGEQNATTYFDDVLIWSITFDEHLQTFETVFKRIRNAGLKLVREPNGDLEKFESSTRF